jgi:HK97 family phage portal protein
MSLWRRQRRSKAWMGSSAPWVSTARSGYADIDASTLDTSLQSVAIRTSADLIASLASELPVDVYRGKGRAKEQVPLPRWLEDPAGDGYGLADWSYRVLMSWLLRGNLYGEELDRGPGGVLRQVEIFHPDSVSGWMEDGAPVWQVEGRRVESGFVHRRVNPIPGRIQGLSPISYHASTIGVSLASTAFGFQWFRDGAHPSGILRNTEVPLDGEGNVRTAKQRFLAALRGVREPLVLGKGWEYQQIQVAPEESQFLETMGYTEAQCARIFGPGIAEVLGYATKGASLTYANLADRDLHLLKYALGKWLRRLERLLSEFLPRPQYVVLNRDALLATTTLQRYQAHASALGAGWKVPNEVRDVEDLEPKPWGDEPVRGAEPIPEPGNRPPADDEEDEDTP